MASTPSAPSNQPDLGPLTQANESPLASAAIQDLTPLTGIVQIAAGGHHTCALTDQGGVQCWGFNHHGQLGDGSTTDRTPPVDVVGLSSDVQAIAAGELHTCALTDQGGVKCWGSNYSGQLGDGSTTFRSTTPVDVVGLASGVQAIAAGGDHTCALTDQGGVQCWGDNYSGQLGDGSTTDRTTPVDVVGLASGVQAIAAGIWHTCALTDQGGVQCWGSNSAGQLGDGSSGNNRTTPVDVVGLPNGVQAIAAGGFHTCALTDQGGIQCWGYNGRGQLGDGSTTDRTTPVDVVGLASGVQAIAAGYWHTCALTDQGGVQCWGDNLWGQLGDGSTTDRTPVDVVGLASGIQAIAAGGLHTCALTGQGGVQCWGDNRRGQLGDGAGGDKAIPVEVVGLPSGVQAIAAGGFHTCALTDQGGVQCWGANDSSQLGDGSTSDRTTPVDVVGLASGV